MAGDTDQMSNGDVRTAILLLDNDIQIMKSTINKLQHQMLTQNVKIKENKNKIELNKQLPWLVANVVEVSSVAITNQQPTTKNHAFFTFVVARL